MNRLLWIVLLVAVASSAAEHRPKTSSGDSGLRAVPITFATQDVAEYAPQWDGSIHICTILSDGSLFKDLVVYGNDPAFSNDGSRIAFVQGGEIGPSQLVVMSSDGKHKEKLTHGELWVRLPAWSPDDKAIAFIGLQRILHSDAFNAGLYVVNSDGKGLRQLTNVTIASHWSPIGKVMSFIAANKQNFATNYTKESLQQLTGLDVGVPGWSPDGKSLAFTALDGKSSEIFILDTASGAVRQLTHLQGVSTSPTWSPTGKEIAFAFDDIHSSRIFVMNADGSNPRELLSSNLTHFYEPAWSPNGIEIAATAERNIGNPQTKKHAVGPLGYRRIVIFNRETLTIRQLKDQSAGHPSFAHGR